MCLSKVIGVSRAKPITVKLGEKYRKNYCGDKTTWHRIFKFIHESDFDLKIDMSNFGLDGNCLSKDKWVGRAKNINVCWAK